MNAKWRANVKPLMEQTVGATRTTLLVLLGAVSFVLLIACANVSNLLLMRAASRRREMAIRMALEAGRRRLLHQLITEGLMLTATGGTVGFLLAYWGVPAIIGFPPAGLPLPRMSEIGVDRAVLAFTLLVSVGCGIFFGIFPALQVDRSRVDESLHQGGRHGSASNRRWRSVLSGGGSITRHAVGDRRGLDVAEFHSTELGGPWLPAGAAAHVPHALASLSVEHL
jgi:hypothetical protein